MKTINNGDRVKCKITGFTGIAVSRTTYLIGTPRVGVQSEKLVAGKPIDSQWFDEPQLTVVKAGAVKP